MLLNTEYGLCNGFPVMVMGGGIAWQWVVEHLPEQLLTHSVNVVRKTVANRRDPVAGTVIHCDAQRFCRVIYDVKTCLIAQGLQLNSVQIAVTGAVRPKQLLHGFCHAAKNKPHRHTLVANLFDEVREMPAFLIVVDTVKFINNYYRVLVLACLSNFQQRRDYAVEVPRDGFNPWHDFIDLRTAALNPKLLPPELSAVRDSALDYFLPFQSSKRVGHQALKRSLRRTCQQHRVIAGRLVRVGNGLSNGSLADTAVTINKYAPPWGTQCLLNQLHLFVTTKQMLLRLNGRCWAEMRVKNFDEFVTR